MTAGGARRGALRRAPAAAGRATLYGPALIPVGIAALGAAVAGRGATAADWWRRLARRPRDTGHGAVATSVVVVHALASLLLGVVALVPLGVVVLSVLRGLFYGLVDPGPYDNAWGGPSRAGAWAAHLLISLPLVAAGLVVLAGIAALHRRLSRVLDGERPGWWVIVVTVLAAVLATLLVIGWTRQI